MRQENIDHFVKNSLENISPEVPEHLWTNIKANIPQPQVHQPGGETAQSGAGATGAGGFTALNLGIAAVVLVGGAALIWQLSTSGPDQQAVIQQPVEQIMQENQIPPSEGHTAINNAPESQTPAPIADQSTTEETQSNQKQPTTTEQHSADVSATQQMELSEETGLGADHSKQRASVSNHEDTEGGQDNDTAFDSNSGQPVVDDGDDETTVDKPIDDSALTPGNEQENASPEITPEPAPFIVVEAGILADQVSGEAPLRVQFSNLSQAKYFEWDFGNGRRSFEAAPHGTFDKPGVYTVQLTVTDFEGNQLRDQMEISVYEPSTFFVPNAFSPNGDGANDFFLVEGVNITDVRFAIYRLDGSLVYEGFGLEAKWDGTDPQDPLGDKYHVVATATKASGDPIQKRVVLTILRD